MMNVDFTLALNAALALLLVYMAWRDTQTYRIANWIVALTAIGALAYWWSIDLRWAEMAIRAGMALLVFALFAAMFALGVMGGGDVKLAAALALWFPWAGTLQFVVIMSLAGGIVSLLAVLNHKLRGKAGKAEVPYGVAIAVGGLWLLTQRFLNHFAG
ncbi:A24 family peptidase [Sphingomicrobium astaxanthinifaciens]|uniref:A24 family peptidase n=1 Tax=Sphingomicrobium astaxanthinifaciens TaxID=1227949 RepID=UPI001FCAEA59|nr:prepilin peptidase [Sphingomicrobium astaxanthinifaciens]MCJ7422071.1 prepilin peptidase [Sphingomicrobium astaxanthinifaciens]